MLRVGQKQREAVARVLEGASYQAAADATGLSRSAVAGACRRAGVKVGRRPEAIAATKAGNIRYWSTPGVKDAFRKIASERAKKQWQNAKRRKALIASQKQGWQLRRLRQEGTHA